jgi:hypothetical protein
LYFLPLIFLKAHLQRPPFLLPPNDGRPPFIKLSMRGRSRFLTTMEGGHRRQQSLIL